MPRWADDETDKTYGKLVVLRRAPNRLENNGVQRAMWLCRCKCGKEYEVSGCDLRRANRPARACASCCQTTHGQATRKSRTLIHRRWGQMIQRCTNPNDRSYPDYGGRGIKVCEQWLNFENFFADLGEIPGPGYSIDRIDNDGDYKPGNCRWAIRTEQNRNRRSNHCLTINGITRTLAEWSEISGLSHSSILLRLKRGMSPQDAVFKPRTRPLKVPGDTP